MAIIVKRAISQWRVVMFAEMMLVPHVNLVWAVVIGFLAALLVTVVFIWPKDRKERKIVWRAVVQLMHEKEEFTPADLVARANLPNLTVAYFSRMLMSSFEKEGWLAVQHRQPATLTSWSATAEGKKFAAQYLERNPVTE